MGLADKSVKIAPKKEGRKVRALYDFEAAEDNELTFSTGDIIYVLDDSDENWWTGYNERGEGLFPSNFVTADLNIDVDLSHSHQQINEEVNRDDDSKQQTEFVQIDEMKIDRLLYLLHEANPEDPSQVRRFFFEAVDIIATEMTQILPIHSVIIQDSEEMFVLEAQVNRMLPLIDSELECVDRNHAKLTQLSTSLVESINMYHLLMRESEFGQPHYYGVSHQNQNQFIHPGFPMSHNPHPHPIDQQYQQFSPQNPQNPQNFIPQNPQH